MKPKHALPVILALALGAPAARAQVPAAKPSAAKPSAAKPSAAPAPAVDEATRVQMVNAFNAGAQAYKAGQYLAAAAAFEKAHALLPSAALLFSAAQAYRRQYLAEPSPATLSRAIALYREYLRKDPQANRREDAMEALQVLVPLERIAVVAPGSGDAGASATGDGSGETAAGARTGRILVSAGVEGAEVSLDGKPFVKAPLVATVEVGAHRARIRAAGHADEEITLQALSGEQVQRHVELRAKPAMLEVVGVERSSVSVDGKLVATVPVPPGAAQIPIEPGSHVVAVTLRGHAPFVRRVEAVGDQTLRLDADLAHTLQRKISWVGLGAGTAGLLTGAVLAGFTFARQSEALSLDERARTTPLSVAERDEYNRAVQERNDFGQAAAVTVGLAGLVYAVSLGLYIFDEPEVVVPADARPAAPKPGPSTTLEVGLGSAGVRVSF